MNLAHLPRPLGVALTVGMLVLSNLLMTFACMALLKKGVNPLIIIIGLFALGICGYAIGLFA